MISWVGVHDAGGDALAEAGPHRGVGAGVEAGPSVESSGNCISPIFLVPASALCAQDRVPRHPGGDIAEGAASVSISGLHIAAFSSDFLVVIWNSHSGRNG